MLSGCAWREQRRGRATDEGPLLDNEFDRTGEHLERPGPIYEIVGDRKGFFGVIAHSSKTR